MGSHPDDGEPIEASIGRYGPYVRHNRTYANIPEGEDVLTIGMNRAISLIAEKAAKRGGRAAQKPLRELGEHPDGGPMNVMDGRYGPYIKWEKVNATIPKEQDPATISFDEALELVNAKAATKRKPKAKKSAAKSKSKKKAADKDA